MAQFLSGRLPKLNVGVQSSTENSTVLQITGKVGIGTEDAGNYNLNVEGDAKITGVVTATTFYGSLVGNVLGPTEGAVVGTSLSVSGISSLSTVTAEDLTTENLYVSGISTLIGNLTVNYGSLHVDSETGFVGVNITSPTTHFEVNGTARVDQDLHVGGTSTSLRIVSTELTGTAPITVASSTKVSNLNVDFLDDQDGSYYRNASNINAGTLGNDYLPQNINIAGILTASQLTTGSGNIGISSNTITGPSVLYIDPAAIGDNTGAVRIKGDLYVDGTQTIINSQTIDLADFRIGIGTTATSDLILDGAGIGIGSDGYQKTFTWDHQNSSLTSSENLNIPSGKTYKIDGVDVISSTTGLGTAVVNSSLTSVGTLNQLNVSGITTLTSLSLGGTVGNPGQYVKSTGSGTVWETFPTLRSTSNFIATPNQTTFSTSYNVGFIDVYVNGIRLTTSEFVATNGTSVVLNIPCFGGEEVDIISYNTVSTGSSVANAQYSGTVTATQGFTSGTGDAVQISVVGNSLTFTVPGVGSTTLTLYP